MNAVFYTCHMNSLIMLKMIEMQIESFWIVIEYVVIKFNRSKSHLKDNAKPKAKIFGFVFNLTTIFSHNLYNIKRNL